MASSFRENSSKAVNETIKKMIECVQGLSEETVRWNPSKEEWSIMQIIAHVAEAIPYWLGEIEKIKENPSVQWGRGITDEVRVQSVSEENISSLSIESVLHELKAATEQTADVLNELTQEQLAIVAPCRNPRFDGKPVEFIISHLIVEHAEKHYGQIQRNLSKLDQK